ncbi:FecCD family ABC transporter permease [Pontiella agarivorans]|uniref:Iron ABC transporter permease n=1 Tax=Pontiella agarivorans TaxID=3038953 RepID=A0ABU5MW35_9BACT|nr:iron ABC transporter permease [Pontiella agarivorans]MDZ8118166.1 iron ABC transporter permease [Pontiella agarivorans]
MNKNGKQIRWLCILAVLLVIAVLVAVSVGAVSIPVSALLSGQLDDLQHAVLFSIRIPRMLLGVIVGSALAVSGGAMQGLFRNPLADPGLIGITSGASLAVAVMIVLIGPTAGFPGIYGLSMAAFSGAIFTCFVIMRFARASQSVSVLYMLLAGIAVNAIAGSATGFLTYISDDQQLRTLTFWTMGSLANALWPTVIVSATCVVPATILIIRNARSLNMLMLGEEDAGYLGVDCDKLKNRLVIMIALAVGAGVAVSGFIGFVGLVVPHLIRLFIGPDHRILLPASALLGAAMLLAADTVSRTVVAPAEIPVGIITSLIGGPFFLWLLIRQYAGRAS